MWAAPSRSRNRRWSTPTGPAISRSASFELLTSRTRLQLPAIFRARRSCLPTRRRQCDKRRPDLKALPSLRGYRFGDLLLVQGASEEALARGLYQLDLALEYLGHGLGLDDVGHAWLLIGRAQDALGHGEASTSLDEAVEGLRKSGME